MKLKTNVSGPKNLAEFPEVKSAAEELQSAQEFMTHGHGSWLDESKVHYNVHAAKCFNGKINEETNEQ